ncbi:perilipin-1 [Anguilla anguilla]|uniref:perilipin-1 n=1 Tax=Anguilla anguilla TaxID=7936 RepID=UPI0015AF9E9E|nr:perilipin-1 [Anguilla anguilla]XP_035252386.1 perilipin-1 [Anguilla anguilla]
MAPEKTEPPCTKDGSLQGSAFLRLLNLPVISSTCEMVERTYSSTKHTHPLICSVCGVYERGAKTAGSLAVWSVKPAIHRLEPQIEAVNNLACRGLDRLEKKIPALQYPPEKLASDISEAFALAVQSARQGIAGTFSSTSDAALGLAGGGYQLTWSTVSDGVSYVMNSRPVLLATEGADTALTLTEHLVNYILPATDEEMEEEAPWEEGADGEDPASQPGYRRLGALASTVCRRAYSHTASRLRRTGTRGRQLVMGVPGVTPLTAIAAKNLEMAGGVVLGLQSTAEGLFGGTDKQTEKERRKKKEGEVLKSGGLRGLVSGLGQQMRSACVSVVSVVKNAPSATLGRAKDGTGALLETLGIARQHVLETASHYGLLPGSSPEGGANGACTAIKEEEEEEEALNPSENSERDQSPTPADSGISQTSDVAQSLQQKVLE